MLFDARSLAEIILLRASIRTKYNSRFEKLSRYIKIQGHSTSNGRKTDENKFQRHFGDRT